MYHLDQSDTEAVLLVYEINRKVQEKNYALMEILQGEQKWEESVPVKAGMEPAQEAPFQMQEEIKDTAYKAAALNGQKAEKQKTRRERKKTESKKEKQMADKQKTEKQQTDAKKTGKKWAAGIVFLVVTGMTGLAVWKGLLNVTQAGGITFLLAGGIGYAVSCEQKSKLKKERKETKSEINWEMPVAEERKEPYVQEEKRDNLFSQEQENVGATTVLRRETAEYEPRMTLISMNSRERNSVVLLKDSYLVGKLKAKTDIWIDDEAISRIHAKIQKEGDDYYLYDMNSTNGTFLNGRRLDVNEKVPLHVADEITFAGVGYYVGNC